MLASLDRRVRSDLRGRLDPLADQDMRVILEPLELKDDRDLQAMLVPQVQQDLQAHPVHLDWVLRETKDQEGNEDSLV